MAFHPHCLFSSPVACVFMLTRKFGFHEIFIEENLFLALLFIFSLPSLPCQSPGAESKLQTVRNVEDDPSIRERDRERGREGVKWRGESAKCSFGVPTNVSHQKCLIKRNRRSTLQTLAPLWSYILTIYTQHAALFLIHSYPGREREGAFPRAGGRQI